MTFLKTHGRGLSFIIIVFALNTYLWVSRLNQSFLNTEVLVTSLFGSFILMSLFMTFLLSTKQRLLVKFFGGLDQVYFWHRFLALMSLGFIFLHQTTASDDGLIILSRYLQLGLDVEELGELSRNLFIFLIVMALFSFLFKYEHFKYLHKLMIIPYGLGLYHGFASSWVDLLSFDALSIFMITTSLLGIFSSLYMLVFYQHVAFKYTGVITEVTHLNASMIDIKLTFKKKYRFKAGQFTFIKLDDKKIMSGSHPFTISGSEDNSIYFTIKKLGDGTKELYESAYVGMKMHVSKPFGHMTFQTKKAAHVWIAGGIGVTPFISYLRSHQVLDKPAHLYYAVKTFEDAVHVNLLNHYASIHKNFTFDIIDSQKQGRMSTDIMTINKDTSVSMCGPKPMIDGFVKSIRKMDKDIELHFEAFSFTGNLVKDIFKYVFNLSKKTLEKLQQ